MKGAKMKKIGVVLIIVSLSIYSIPYSHAQVVNAYAKVTSIAGKVLTLSNVNEAFHTFNVGESVIVMQMQDNVIGGTNDNTMFGTVGTIGSAGLYEVGEIGAKTATTMTLISNLVNPYNTGTNSSVQIISFRLYGNPDFITSGDMSALDWDGNIGGVLAIKVGGVLTLNHNITANGAGFRGGTASTNEGTNDCNLVWRTNNSNLAGQKGEGIFKSTDVNQHYGRAKIINGGGGGNRHNAGGAGGGHVNAGGNGGPGYNCTGNPVGGQGGLSLSSYININRIFMGGGGGGGQQNNSTGTAGTDGGGIILIRAAHMITSGTCIARSISVNGLNAGNPSNDGSGGAGAGGTIVLDADSFTVLAACPVTVSANGGNGGTANDPGTHGGGGGGSQGKIFYSKPAPANVTNVTNNGVSGCNNNSTPCNSQAAAPSGVNGGGIADNSGGTVLPIQLKSFELTYHKGKVFAEWMTASELNNDFFTLERSSDGIYFETVLLTDGAGTTNEKKLYQIIDADPLIGKAYYRLKQTDWDNKEESLGVRSIFIDDLPDPKLSVSIFPNPSNLQHVTISLSQANDQLQVEVITLAGQPVVKHDFHTRSKTFTIELPAGVSPGIYLVKTLFNGQSIVSKLIIE